MTWRDEQGNLFDVYGVQIDELLAYLDDAEDYLTVLGETKLVTETRGYSGGMRALRNQLQSKSQNVRRSDASRTVFDISLTTRKVGHER